MVEHATGRYRAADTLINPRLGLGVDVRQNVGRAAIGRGFAGWWPSDYLLLGPML